MKAFDCVEMKNAIQARLRRERAGMFEEDVRAAVRRELATGSDPLARLWQTLDARRKR
ncbi:hypothetical protein HQ560_07805 [bacterium]|nr:hypothetical protein [bacterium]